MLGLSRRRFRVSRHVNGCKRGVGWIEALSNIMNRTIDSMVGPAINLLLRIVLWCGGWKAIKSREVPNRLAKVSRKEPSIQWPTNDTE